MRLPAQRRAARRSAHWDVQPPSLAALCLHSPMLHSPAVDLRATRCVQRSTLAARLAARHPRQACGRTSDSLHACVPHQLQAELSEAAALAQPQLIARPPQQLRSPTRRSECSRPSSWSAEASGPSHGQPGRIRAEAATSTAMARLASSADQRELARRFRGAQKCRYGAVRYTLLTAYQGPRAFAPRRLPGGPIKEQSLIVESDACGDGELCVSFNVLCVQRKSQERYARYNTSFMISRK